MKTITLKGIILDVEVTYVQLQGKKTYFQFEATCQRGRNLLEVTIDETWQESDISENYDDYIDLVVENCPELLQWAETEMRREYFDRLNKMMTNKEIQMFSFNWINDVFSITMLYTNGKSLILVGEENIEIIL